MKFALYMHGGSGNHGCEALVRTSSALLSELGEVRVFSKSPEEDEKYIEGISAVACGKPLSKKTLSGALAAVKIKFFKQPLAYLKPSYKSLIKYVDGDTVAVSRNNDIRKAIGNKSQEKPVILVQFALTRVFDAA